MQRGLILLAAILVLGQVSTVRGASPAPGQSWLSPHAVAHDQGNPWQGYRSAEESFTTPSPAHEKGYPSAYDDDPYSPDHLDWLFGGWGVELGAVLLERRPPRDTPFLYDAGANPIFYASDVHLGFDGGPLLRLRRDLSPGRTLEAIGYGINSVSDQWETNGPFTGTDAYGTAYSGTGAGMDYSARLYSFELNLKSRFWYGWSAICGYRWMEIADQARLNLLDVTLAGTGFIDDATYKMNTINTLNGFQLGLEHESISIGAWRLDAAVKGGIFANAARGEYTFGSTTGESGAFRADRRRAGFVGEIITNLVWQPFECFSVYGGYEVMWVDPAVYAVNQMHGHTLGQEQIEFNDTGLYHGVRMGMRLDW